MGSDLTEEWSDATDVDPDNVILWDEATLLSTWDKTEYFVYKILTSAPDASGVFARFFQLAVRDLDGSERGQTVRWSQINKVRRRPKVNGGCNPCISVKLEEPSSGAYGDGSRWDEI